MAGEFVVDASVLVEFLAPNGFVAATDRFLGALKWPRAVQLYAPDLVYLEAASALRKLAARKSIPPTRADRGIKELVSLSIATVPALSILEAAWSLRHRLTVYDATYVSLARALAVPLITADRRLARGARSAGVRAWLVDDPELGLILDALETTD